MKSPSHTFDLNQALNYFSAPDMINRQAVLCHRVLRTIQSVVVQSTVLDQDTWECLLLFLLAINDSLLAPPTIPGILFFSNQFLIFMHS